MELRLLILPGSGKGLKFPHGELMRLEAELAAADRTMTDLLKQPLLAAARYVQIGRAWEEAITLDEAAELVDQAKCEGVPTGDLLIAMLKTAGGRHVTVKASFDPDVEDVDTPEESDDAAPPNTAETRSKNVAHGVPFVKVQ
jgi:hypothetical protein